MHFIPRTAPAAFAYDVSGPQPYTGFWIRIVRTKGVKIDGQRVREIIDSNHSVTVYEKVVDSIDDVPPQGTYLDPANIHFQQWDNFKETLSARAKKQVMLIETIIGLYSPVGTLYDIAQFAYAAITGKDFWGETIREEELLLMGVCVLLPIAFSAKQTLHTLTAVSRRNKLLRAALADDTIKEVSKRVDKDLLTAARSVPIKEQEKVLDVVQKFSTGAATSKQVLKVFDSAVSGRFLDVLENRELVRTFEREANNLFSDSVFQDAIRTLGDDENAFFNLFRAYRAGAVGAVNVVASFNDRMRIALRNFTDQQRLLEVFADDFAGFRIEPLASGYKNYVTKGGKANPREWVLRQTTGRYRNTLVQTLGENYDRLVKETLGDSFVYEVTPKQLAAFDKIIGIVHTEQYRDLRKLVGQAGIGHLFEVDHLFEKRFFKSIDTDIDESDVFSLLVPKNPAVARQLPRYDGYAHSVKTQMLRKLIPNGAEDLYTFQQWWDAHVYVYKALGTDPAVYQNRLRQMFEQVAEDIGESFEPRFNQTKETFDIAKGWKPRRLYQGTSQ